ncbi:MAG: hypothetical protein ACKVPX_14465 [Myxococcaceae bacterium]
MQPPPMTMTAAQAPSGTPLGRGQLSSRRAGLWVLLLGLPFLSAASAPAGFELLGGLAAFNLLLLGALLARALAVRRLELAPVVGFLPGLLSSWPLAGLYFLHFSPHATYVNRFGETPLLYQGEWVQLCLAVFVVPYFVFIWPLLRPRSEEANTVPESIDFEWWLLAVGLVSVNLGWLISVTPLGSALVLAGNALRNFFTGFCILAGLRWNRWSPFRKQVIAVALLACLAANTLANARGYAINPLLVAVLGYALARDVARRRQVILFGALLALLPLYLAVGNQTRLALHSVGFANIEERTAVMSRALRGDLQHGEGGGFVEDAMRRQYSAGGHSLIIQDWGRVSLSDFNVLQFVREGLRVLLPAFLFGQAESLTYTGTEILLDYGWLITTGNSVEVSMVGSLFHQGGLVMVGLGGVLLAVLHRALAALIQRKHQLAALAGVVALLSLWGYNLDFIAYGRGLVWGMFYALLAIRTVGSALQPRKRNPASPV